MAGTGALDYYARDLYPENPGMETSLLSVPTAQEQKVLEVDEEAVKQAEKVQTGGTKNGIFATLRVIVGIIALFTIFKV